MMRKILVFCFFFHPVAMSTTYYDILDIPKESSQEEIKRAYNRLMGKFHSDRNKDPGATQRTQEINEAYSTLRDPDRRAEYDNEIDSVDISSLISVFELADRALYGDIDAMKIMGTKLEQAGFPHESFKYWLKATKKGDEEARMRLQGLYDQGIGTRSERREAFVLLGFRGCLARFFRR